MHTAFFHGEYPMGLGFVLQSRALLVTITSNLPATSGSFLLLQKRAANSILTSSPDHLDNPSAHPRGGPRSRRPSDMIARLCVDAGDS